MGRERFQSRRRSSLLPCCPARSGFTLIEVIIAAGAVALTAAGILHMFAYSLWETEDAGHLSVAMGEAYGKTEELRNAPFDTLKDVYGPGGEQGPTFKISEPEGVGVVYLDSKNPDLLEVEIVVCWRERGIVVGEDQNLNGVLDIGEDFNNNGRLDSAASTATMIGRK